MNKQMSKGHFEGIKDAFEREEGRGPIAFVPVIETDLQGHFGLGVAVANERGYNPLPAGFACFESYDLAEAEATRLNGLLKLDHDTAWRIVASTMGGKLYRDAA